MTTGINGNKMVVHWNLKSHILDLCRNLYRGIYVLIILDTKEETGTRQVYEMQKARDQWDMYWEPDRKGTRTASS